MRFLLFTTVFLFISTLCCAQGDAELFTFGDESVPVSEFLYVFEKNNINADSKSRKERIDEYLDLYINFKLKVKQAEALGLDTVQKLQRELDGYRSQLAKNYLSDDDITDKLLKEAYERSKQEVEVSHILVTLSPDALPSDTLKAYNEAAALKRKLSGTSFQKLAVENSDDPSSKDNMGYLGYLSAFQVVYPFESGMYNTPVGSVSDPVRSKYGYHLIKVTDKRDALGKITTAHILIKSSEDAPEAVARTAKSTIDGIYKRLESGQSTFDAEARKYSQDRTTASSGGVLPEVGSGVMYEAFEKAAFSLAADGDISAPVQTEIGWHIIKRIKLRKIGEFKDAQYELKKKIEKDSRAAVSEKKFIDGLKIEYGFRQNNMNVKNIIESIDPKVASMNWVPNDKVDSEKELFTFAQQKIKAEAFIKYLQKNRPKRQKGDKDLEDMLKRSYEDYVNGAVLEYEDSQLEEKYPSFKKLMKEYRDGILLFELTDNKIWSYAVKDTAGLNNFFAENNEKYMWEERADATMLSSKEKFSKPAKILKWLMKNKHSKLSKKYPNVISDRSYYEKGDSERIDATQWKEGIYGPEQWGEEHVIIKIHGTIPPSLKKLSDAKGYVVADYQEYLEKIWIKKLRTEYPVEVNSDVLKSLY